MNRLLLTSLFGGGLLLSAIGFSGLQKREEGIRHHRNPFAIEQSGFGKTLARLSQNTIDVVWHLGIEQINPMDHDHHDHEHDHEHSRETGPESDPAAVELTDEEKELLAASNLNEKALHCATCRKAVAQSLKSGQTLTEEDLLAVHAHHADQENGGVDAHDHHHHDHGDHHHDELAEAAGDHGWLEEAKEWMHDLGAARYNRTSPFAASGAHKKAVAADIEKLLLRAYKMDPTDYGVYNAYYLFLTIHEFGGTPSTREHARLISRMTIANAMKETVDPQPWVTAAIATMNLFFLKQEDLTAKGAKPPVAMLEEFQRQMAYCLHQVSLLREQTKAEGRWEAISEDRRKDLAERERFASMAARQFETMLASARSVEEKPSPSDAPAQGKPSGTAVADSAVEKADEAGDR